MALERHPAIDRALSLVLPGSEAQLAAVLLAREPLPEPQALRQCWGNGCPNTCFRTSG